MSIQDVGVRVFLQPLDMIGQDASDFGRRGCKAVSLQAPLRHQRYLIEPRSTPFGYVHVKVVVSGLRLCGW